MSYIDYKLGLEKAIATLYKTFKSYPLNSDMKGCPCCVNPKNNELLLSKSLIELTSNNLNEYAFKAALTWGDVDDLKHFLPRILELWAGDKNLFYGEFTVSRLSAVGLKRWDKKEQRAIYRYLIALWQYILSKYPSPSIEIADLIDCLSDVIDKFELLLLIWQNHASVNSLLHLSDFVLDGIEFDRDPISSIYLDDKDTATFINWVTHNKTIVKLEQCLDRNIEQDYAEQLAMALDILNN